MAAIGSTPFERGDEAEGFLIVTAAADQGLVDIHDRRPLVLSPEAAQEWMRQEIGGKEALSENAIITKMARELNVDFSIVWGKLEKFREDVLGNLVINVEVKDKEKVIEYLESKNVVLEVLN